MVSLLPDHPTSQPVRAQVRAAVERDLAAVHPALRLGEVDSAALGALGSWTGRAVAWDWHKITRVKRDARLDLAIWSGTILCGVAWGSVAPDWVSISWLEGNPDAANPLRGYVTKIALALLETYAFVLGCEEMRIVGPLPQLIPHYERFGYVPILAKKRLVGYMAKRVAI